MSSGSVERRFAAILHADVVGYSNHMVENEERTLKRLSASRCIFIEKFDAHRGRLFGEAGDAIIAEFSSPVEAARAAVEIQQGLAQMNAAHPELRPFQFRIGINLGDIMVEDGNLYGEGVNLATRIQTIAQPGGIAISSHVHTYIRNKIDYELADMGLHEVKNAEDALHIFSIIFPLATEQSAKQLDDTQENATNMMSSSISAAAAAAKTRKPSKRTVRKALASMPAVMETALDFLQRSSDIEHAGERLPWLLFLGGADSGVGELLESAAVASPLAPPDLPTASEIFQWSWWFFKELIAIEASHAFVDGLKENDRHEAWGKALQLLKKHQSDVPLSGLVVCVPQHLLLQAEECRSQAFAIRRLLDQATTALGVQVPVYLLITRLDDIEGFTQFASFLPDSGRHQAVGHVIEDPASFVADKDSQANAIRRIADRFESLRLGMLRHETSEEKRHGVFEFIHQYCRLADGTLEMIENLTVPSDLQHDVHLRGVFWVANGPLPAFYHDLFSRFLPQDQPLAHIWSKKGSSGHASSARAAN